MASYPNGRFPRSLLVSRPSSGKGDCLMFPGTAYKYDKLVALAQAERNWTPMVSGPNDGYRSYEAQEYYFQNEPPGNASYPGTSSHGGVFNGVDSGALDIGNWGQVGRAVFYDLARRAGFEPNYFDWEPWHIIDWSPWDVPEATVVTQTRLIVPALNRRRRLIIQKENDNG